MVRRLRFKEGRNVGRLAPHPAGEPLARYKGRPGRFLVWGATLLRGPIEPNLFALANRRRWRIQLWIGLGPEGGASPRLPLWPFGEPRGRRLADSGNPEESNPLEWHFLAQRAKSGSISPHIENNSL